MEAIKLLLDRKAEQYNRPEFIEKDPISIPHRFTKLQDIEIAAFFSAILAWGRRETIIKKTDILMSYMDFDPHNFILRHTDNDLKPLSNFKHRTFNGIDTLYFIRFLKQYYQKYISLEDAFTCFLSSKNGEVREVLTRFHNYFFSLENFPQRTQKHIPTPLRGSACKRLNMFLRWMVRKDKNGVDFGLWNKLKPSQLICPLDVHVLKTARYLKLVDGSTCNWKIAYKLTEKLKSFDPSDPVKYDFALFSMSINHVYSRL